MPITNINDLHVYSALCFWHGKIEDTGRIGHGLPCCPHCKSVLLQTEENRWWEGAKEYQDAGHPNYIEFLHWTQKQPRCYPTRKDAAIAFKEATGKEVES